MKKKALSLFLGAVLTQTALFAKECDISILKKSYNAGLSDALTVLKKDINNYNKTINLNGYGVYIDIENMPITDIIKYEALGIKLGFNPVVADGRLYFSIEDRKADAQLVKQAVLNHSALSRIKIEKVNKKVKYKSLIENYIERQIPQKAILVYVKEENAAPVSKVIINCNTDLHFVNRVLTQKAFDKYCNGNINQCMPKININKESIEKTKNQVQKTLGKKDINFDTGNFYSIAKIISNYGVITKNNKLLIGRKVYQKGDYIGKYKIMMINYNKGIVLIGYTKIFANKSE